MIEIIQRYPDKIKGVETDELFMNEREIEAIKFYDSYHSGLNMTPGGNQFALGAKHTAEMNKAKSKQMTGKKRGKAYNKPKTVQAKMHDDTLIFASSLQAAQKLSIKFNKNFDQSSISKACRGMYSKKKSHVYQGIHFKYD